jgi:hypothetical protein
MNIHKFIETMPMESFPISLLKEIKILSFAGPKSNKPLSRKILPRDDLVEIFGSANYRMQKYGADVDGIQGIYGTTSLEDFLEKLEKKMKSIVRSINKAKTHYMTEIKAGIDVRYKIDIGKCINGIYTLPSNFPITINKMYEAGLFNKLEYTRFVLIVKKSSECGLNGDDYDVVYNTVRERLILRWTSKEILQGYKQLEGNYYITLIDALKLSTPTKIDMIVLYDGKFIEITNFLVLALEVKGKYYALYKDFPLTEREKDLFIDDGLKSEIEKLLYSNYHYSPFKAVKRTFALARARHDANMLTNIIPIVSQDLSLLYQIKSEIDADIIVLTYAKSPPVVSVNKHLDNIKLRIAKVLLLDTKILKDTNNTLNQAMFIRNPIKKAQLLTELSGGFKKLINYHSIEYFTKINNNPMQMAYLPSTHKYRRRQIDPSYQTVNPIVAIDKYIGENMVINIPKSKILSKNQLKRIPIASNDEILKNISDR